MKTLIYSYALVLSLVTACFSQGSPLPPSVQKIWFSKNESAGKKTLLAVPRATIRPVYELFRGKVVQRAKSTGKSIYTISEAGIKKDENLAEKAGYQSADGLLNPGATLNNALSDAGMLIKSPAFDLSPLSKRVKVCTSNLQSGLTRDLTVLDQIDPMEHMAVMIDGEVHETTDPRSSHDLTEHISDGGEIMCRPAPLVKNQAEVIAIQKLYCADQNYGFDYNFITNNCDGYTKDILKIAGYSLPDFTNLGLGSDTIRTHFADRGKEISLAKEKCNSQISNLLKMITDLENGRAITEENLRAIQSTSVLSDDSALQLVVSAARGANPASRDIVKKLVIPQDSDGPFLDHHAFEKKHEEKIASIYRFEVKTMLGDLSAENLNWISKNFSWAGKLIQLNQ